MVPQKGIQDVRKRQLVIKKMEQVVDRRYLGEGDVKSLTSYFAVDKVVEDGKVLDICMVYDGTMNRFNDSVEVPKFGLPTINTHLRAVDVGYHMVDADVGGCLLNFILT
jgi:hypothetical protein